MRWIFTLIIFTSFNALADDVINTATQNADNSWSFNVTFDNGSGLFGNTNVILPAPSDGSELIQSAAESAMTPIAAAQKAYWVSIVGGTPTIIGLFTL